MSFSNLSLKYCRKIIMVYRNLVETVQKNMLYRSVWDYCWTFDYQNRCLLCYFSDGGSLFSTLIFCRRSAILSILGGKRSSMSRRHCYMSCLCPLLYFTPLSNNVGWRRYRRILYMWSGRFVLCKYFRNFFTSSNALIAIPYSFLTSVNLIARKPLTLHKSCNLYNVFTCASIQASDFEITNDVQLQLKQGFKKYDIQWI